MSLPIRRATRSPGRVPIRRASAGVSAARIGAAVLAIAMAGAVYGVQVSPAFALDRVDVTGAEYTSQAAVRAALGLGSDAHPNLFGLDTEHLRAALLALPAVTDAQVRAVLPDRLEVTIVERVPVLAWRIGTTRYLVDADGVVVVAIAQPASDATASPVPGSAGTDPSAAPGASGSARATAKPSGTPRTKATPSPTPGASAAPDASGVVAGAATSAAPDATALPGASASPGPGTAPANAGAVAAGSVPDDPSLPTFIDLRSKRPSLAAGMSLDPTDLAVARLLGTLTPKAVGSKAPSLRITITDRDGFAIDAGTGRWRAVFGMYTATLRSPDLIPAQVQCLRSLLATGESKIQLVYLFPDGDQCGTFTKKASS